MSGGSCDPPRPRSVLSRRVQSRSVMRMTVRGPSRPVPGVVLASRWSSTSVLLQVSPRVVRRPRLGAAAALASASRVKRICIASRESAKIWSAVPGATDRQARSRRPSCGAKDDPRGRPWPRGHDRDRSAWLELCPRAESRGHVAGARRCAAHLRRSAPCRPVSFAGCPWVPARDAVRPPGASPRTAEHPRSR